MLKSIETLNKFENKLFNSDFVYEFNIEDLQMIIQFIKLFIIIPINFFPI